MNSQKMEKHFNRVLSEFFASTCDNDVNASATLNLFKTNKKFYLKVMEAVEENLTLERKRMLDIGCGYGGLTKVIADALGFKEVFGVDLDDQRLAIAENRSIITTKMNLERDHLPFPSNHFELVTSFGVLEHLKFYDNLINEAHRVLKKNGLFLISTTNLASWVNRLTLLFGYQPRNLEISKQGIFGVNRIYYKVYVSTCPIGHISGATYYALKGLLEAYGFSVVKDFGGGVVLSPDFKSNTITGKLAMFLDSIFSTKASLSIRLFILAKKVR